MPIDQKRQNRSGLILAVLVWVWFSAALIQNSRWPTLTFDPAFYAGLTKADRYFDDQEVFQATRSELSTKGWVTGPNYLASDNYYAKKTLNDQKTFAREVNFYRIKFGYLSFSRAVYSFTGDALSSLRIVSFAGLLLIICIPPLILNRYRVIFGLIFLPAIWVGCDMLATVRLITPDVLGIGATLLLFGAWLSRSRIAVLIGSAIVTSIRPEFTFFALGILIATLFSQRLRMLALCGLFGSLAVSMIVKMFVAYPGWWQHLSMVLLSPADVVDGAPPFSIQLLAKGALNVWFNAGLHSNWLWALIAIAILYLSKKPSADEKRDGCPQLFWGLMLGALGRLFAFPTLETRLFLPVIIVTSILLIIRIQPNPSALNDVILDLAKKVGYLIPRLRRN